MKTRLITGILLGLFVVPLILFTPLTLLKSVVVVFTTLAILEWDKLFFRETDRLRQFRLASVSILTVLALSHHLVAGLITFWFSFIFLCGTSVFHWKRVGSLSETTSQWAFECVSFCLTVSAFGFLIPIGSLNHGRFFLLLLFLFVFLGDTAAYFVGTWWGKHPLALNLSPKKTTEGAIASFVMSLLVIIIGYHLELKDLYGSSILIPLLVFAPMGSFLAQLGDLFESLLKRSREVKDSGTVFPGHGGVWDRIDGLLFVTPVYFVFITHYLGANL